jgi:hypothetical protein
MLEIFKAKPFLHDALGSFRRFHGKWIGNISMDGQTKVDLILQGDRKGPDERSLRMAEKLLPTFASLKSEIALALYDHYKPYFDEPNGENIEEIPVLNQPHDVWKNVSIQYVLIEKLRGSPLPGPTIEIAFDVSWDDEHTVGARIQGDKLIELCGSVGPIV